MKTHLIGETSLLPELDELHPECSCCGAQLLSAGLCSECAAIESGKEAGTELRRNYLLGVWEYRTIDASGEPLTHWIASNYSARWASSTWTVRELSLFNGVPAPFHVLHNAQLQEGI